MVARRSAHLDSNDVLPAGRKVAAASIAAGSLARRADRGPIAIASREAPKDVDVIATGIDSPDRRHGVASTANALPVRPNVEVVIEIAMRAVRNDAARIVIDLQVRPNADGTTGIAKRVVPNGAATIAIASPVLPERPIGDEWKGAVSADLTSIGIAWIDPIHAIWPTTALIVPAAIVTSIVLAPTTVVPKVQDSKTVTVAVRRHEIAKKDVVACDPMGRPVAMAHREIAMATADVAGQTARRVAMVPALTEAETATVDPTRTALAAVIVLAPTARPVMVAHAANAARPVLAAPALTAPALGVLRREPAPKRHTRQDRRQKVLLSPIMTQKTPFDLSR